MTPAEERASHPEGPIFTSFFERMLLKGTVSSFERKVLIDVKDQAWEAWKRNAIEFDGGEWWDVK